MTECNNDLMNTGRPYPRTCAKCGLGPCNATSEMLVQMIDTSGGGKLSGDHYYRVRVGEPISPEVEPYTAECAGIIEALGMTFNEGEAFKALWRLAAARQGRGKAGNKPQYDADKAAHYGQRVAAHTRAQESRK